MNYADKPERTVEFFGGPHDGLVATIKTLKKNLIMCVDVPLFRADESDLWGALYHRKSINADKTIYQFADYTSPTMEMFFDQTGD